MAILKKHIPLIHDIHAYGQSWSFDPRSEGIPAFYNKECQGSHIDWSGVSLRNRSYCRMINPMFTAGFTAPLVESDINFWNTCNTCSVLISPKHALICQHYRGTHERVEEYYSFLGRNGQKHTRKVVAAYLSVGSDHTLLEFDAEFPNDVKFYNLIADVQYISNGSHFWIHDCNGKCYKMIFEQALVNSVGDVSSFSYAPLMDGINDGINANGWPGIHVGDSGSPAFIESSRGETIFIGLMQGGMQINTREMNTINSIISSKGYSISHYKIIAKKEDVNQDGKVDASDMSIVMNSWGNGSVFADINMDGDINSEDMAMLLSAWGQYNMLPNVSAPPTQVSSDSLNIRLR